MKKQICFNLILAVVAVSLLATQAPAFAVSPDTLDLELSYSSVEKAEFTGEYWFVINSAQAFIMRMNATIPHSYSND